MQTNTNIPIYRTVKNWKGAVTSSLVGSYDVWFEYGTVYNFKTINGAVVKTEVGKGFVIIEELLELSGCYIIYAGIRYDVNTPDTFYDRKGNFHHMEFTFK